MEPTWVEITSPQNPKIKEVARLRAERQRKRQNRILIDGIREIQRAADSGFQIESLFLCDTAEDLLHDPEFLQAIPADHRYRLAEPAFRKIAFGERNEGVVAVAIDRPISLSDLQLDDHPFIIVLDGIEKPGNVGAVFRTASAAGVDAILLTHDRCHPFNANAIRASLGTVFELPFVCESVDNVIRFLQERGIRIVTTRVDATTDYTELNYAQPVALVLGSEAEGVDSAWHDFDSVIIPMNRSVDSLNISVTAAIVTFEARRQRKSPAK